MSIESVTSEINKKFGAGTLVTGDKAIGLKVTKMSTGCDALDYALNGGWALGRMIEIVGEFSTGKTTLACKAAIEFSRINPDGYVLYIDAERAFDVNWYRGLGGDPKNVIVCHPSSGEESGDVAVSMLKHARKQNDKVFIVVDSISALVPMHESEEDMDNAQPATQARLVNKLLRKLTVELRKDLLSADQSFTVMFLNQVRQKIGIAYGNPNTKSGGKGIDFFVSQQVFLSRKNFLSKEIVVNGEKRKPVYGMTISFRVSKNKCQGFQNETGEYNLYIKNGDGYKARSFDNQGCTLTSALLFDIVKRTKNVYEYDGKSYANRPKIEEAMINDSKMYLKIKREVFDRIALLFNPSVTTKKKSGIKLGVKR